DPVHPKYGRFIRLQNPDKGATGGMSGDLDEWDPSGGDSFGGDDRNSRGFGKGYVGTIDNVFVSSNQATKITPQIKPADLKILKPRIVFWDQVLRVLTVEEQCLTLAKALRGAKDLLQRAWADHPEYLSADVRKIFAGSKQVFVWAG